MKRAGALLLGVLLLCVAIPSFAFAQSETAGQTPLTPVEQLVDNNGNVVFSDTVVENAVRDALGIPEGPITPKQLGKLGAKQEQLNIESSVPMVADLSILQLCTKLKILYLDNVTPANLSAVTAVKSLTYFGARQIQITDLRFLVGLKGLTDVWIGECPCEDISAITDMPKLVNFSIDTHIADITPLLECKKLVAVSLASLTDAQVNTLLDTLGRKLTGLGLNTCIITDETLDRIAGLKLRRIMLDNTPVRSIAPLWNIKTLQRIDLYNMRIDSLNGIQNLKKLKNVCFIGIKNLVDYRPLFQQKSLQTLKFASAEAPDLEGIQNLINLEQLSLEELHGAVELTPVFALAKLKQLSLNTVTVNTFEGVGGLLALTDLTLYQVGGIEDFTPLFGLKKLRNITTDTPEKIPDGLPVN